VLRRIQMMTRETDPNSSPRTGSDGRRKLSWILFSTLVVFISMVIVLIGRTAAELAKVFEEMRVATPGIIQAAMTLCNAWWISIPIWLTISLGGALAIQLYSRKPARHMRMVNILMILLAVFIMAALCCAIFIRNFSIIE
jgi:hypothetical protein